MTHPFDFLFFLFQIAPLIQLPASVVLGGRLMGEHRVDCTNKVPHIGRERGREGIRLLIALPTNLDILFHAHMLVLSHTRLIYESRAPVEFVTISILRMN